MNLLLGVFLPAAILSACAVLPGGYTPDEDKVQDDVGAGLPEQWTVQATVLQDKSDLRENLYGLIKSPELQSLVKEAITNNQDLKAAAMRLQASRLALAETRSQRLPQLNLTLNRTRGSASGSADSLSSNLGNEIEQTYSGGFTLAWELDLWQRLADQHRAAKKNYSADRWEFQAAQNSMLTRVVQAWINLWSLGILIDVEQERLRLLASLEETITDAYRSGLGTLEDVAVARSSAHSARATLEQRKEQRRAARRAFEVLLGRYPGANAFAFAGLPEIALPISRVPAIVMAERADIQAAFNRLQAFNAQTRAAYKALLPNINLEGGINRGNSHFNRITSAATGWSLVADVIQPLFNGGRLINLARAQSTQARAQIFDYQYKVLQAMEEVENALSLEYSLARQQTHYQNAYEDSIEVLADYRQRYSNGLATILDVLQVQTRTLDYKIALTETRAERLNNRLTLGLALGLTLEGE